MKTETIKLYHTIYTKMLEKISKKVKDEDLQDALDAAMVHVALVPAALGFDEDAYDVHIDEDEEGWSLSTTFDGHAVEKLEVTGKNYATLIAKSFVAVGEDDFLNNALGLENYIDIVEQANWLVLEGIKTLENVDMEESKKVLNDVSQFFIDNDLI